MIPVIFVHYGPIQDYLKVCIDQAAKNNEVILISDQDHAGVKATTFSMKDLKEEADKFEKVYHHLSKNPQEFELRCFTRWGLIKALMEKEGIGRVFYCDSDVLLYKSADLSILSTIDIGYSVPSDQPEFRWSASAHISVFSYEKLSKLWTFMVDTYSNRSDTFSELKRKYKHHLSAQKPGGVCDMTLLYLFAQQEDVHQVCSIIDGSTFDHNINSSENLIRDEYDMRNIASPHGPISIKNIRFVDGVPICLNLDLDMDVKFNSLHFQGAAKSLIQQFVV